MYKFEALFWNLFAIPAYKVISKKFCVISSDLSRCRCCLAEWLLDYWLYQSLMSNLLDQPWKQGWVWSHTQALYGGWLVQWWKSCWDHKIAESIWRSLSLVDTRTENWALQIWVGWWCDQLKNPWTIWHNQCSVWVLQLMRLWYLLYMPPFTSLLFLRWFLEYFYGAVSRCNESCFGICVLTEHRSNVIARWNLPLGIEDWLQMVKIIITVDSVWLFWVWLWHYTKVLCISVGFSQMQQLSSVGIANGHAPESSKTMLLKVGEWSGIQFLFPQFHLFVSATQM